MNPYQVLGVDENADTSTIKEAYRKLARKHHPDRGGDVDKFKEATEAYSILSDQQKRHQYHNSQSRSGFENVFGQGFNPFADLFSFHRTSNKQQVKLHTEDSEIQFNLKVNLEQIKKGASTHITYHRNKICHTCNGQGGQGRKGCVTCGGSGSQMFKPNPQIIQRVTCSACNGHGIVFDNPCITCETKGFVQYEEEIAVRVEEQL
tara:strand:+ start:433 stop:1047 length:615 start_codon:yes stop_codon:yes gene_type:complete